MKDGTVGSRSIDQIKKSIAVNWIFHENDDVDIALIPFGLDPQKDDVKTIPENLFLRSDKLFELYDVFFLSYQPGIQPPKKISPVIRNGTISLINEDKTFYIVAREYIRHGAVPESYSEDAYHIASCYKRGRLSFELELQAHSEEENERHSEMVNTLNNLRQIEIMAPAELL